MSSIKNFYEYPSDEEVYKPMTSPAPSSLPELLSKNKKKPYIDDSYVPPDIYYALAVIKYIQYNEHTRKLKLYLRTRSMYFKFSFMNVYKITSLNIPLINTLFCLSENKWLEDLLKSPKAMNLN
jgi:hypothetical protein